MALTKTITLKIDGVDKAISSVEELNSELIKVDKNADIDLTLDPSLAVKELKAIDKAVSDVSKKSEANFQTVKKTIEDSLNPSVIIKNFKAISDEVGLTANEAKELGKVLKELSPRSDEFVEASALLKTFREDVTGAKEGAAALAAELGAFDSGSIDDLNAQLKFFQGEMDGSVAGTEKFIASGKKIDELKLKLEALSKTPREQRKLFTDLGVSVSSSFTTGAAALSSFGAENENVEKAILKIQQALALVETVRSAIEAAQLARQAILILQTRQQTAETLNLAAAQQVQATTAESGGKGAGLLSKGFGAVSGGIRTAIGAVRAFGAALLANPVGAITAAIVGLGLVLFALKDKFKPIQQAFDFLSDATSGLIGFFGNLFSSTEKIKNLFITLLPVIAAPLIPLAAMVEGVIQLGKAFGFFEDVPSLFESYKNAVISTGKEIANETKLAERKRKLAVQESNAAILKEQEDLEISRLSITAGNEDKIYEIKKRQLERERLLNLSRTIVEARLTQSEIDIIKSGNSEKIALLEQRLKKEGRLNEEAVESLKKFQESEIELAKENQKEKERLIDKELNISNIRRDLEIQRIEDSNKTSDKIKAVEIDLQKQLAAFQAMRAKGESVTNEEVILAREKANKAILALERALEDERAKIKENTSDILLEQRIKELENQDTLDAKIRAKDLKLAEDKKDLEEQLVKDIAAFPELEVELREQTNAEKLELEKQYNSDVQELREEDFQKQVELENRRLDATKRILDAETEAAESEFNNDSNSYDKRIELLNNFTDDKLESLRLETESALKQDGLLAEEREAIIKESENKRLAIIKDSNDKLDKLNKDRKDKEDKDAQDADDKFKEKLNKIASEAKTYSDAAFQIFDSINKLITQQEEQQLSVLESRAEKTEELIDKLDSKVQESSDKQKSLSEELADSNEKDRGRIIRQLEREAAREQRLQKQKIKQEEELKKIEEEKRKIKKDQFIREKAASIIQAIISTALATITGFVQGGPVLAAIAAATGAITIATIAAQPIPEFAKGGFTGEGTKRDHTGFKQAGIVHEGEWVAPKWMVDSPRYSPVIREMESYRYRGYAQGGFVGVSPVTPDNSLVLNELSKMAQTSLELANRPIFVSVLDINSSQSTNTAIVTSARF